MKKILAFGASNSQQSINKVLATYTANQVENVEVIVADLNDYILPLYGVDEEKANGTHENAKRFDELLASVDGIVVSFAEYNGNFSTAFKNLFDWLSRIDMKTVWKNKPMFVLATSPGGRGGAGVLSIVKNTFPYFGSNIVAEFSLPSFHENFKDGIIDGALAQTFTQQVKAFETALSA